MKIAIWWMMRSAQRAVRLQGSIRFDSRAVQMNIQIGGGAEALDERDRRRFSAACLPRKSFPLNPESRFYLC